MFPQKQPRQSEGMERAQQNGSLLGISFGHLHKARIFQYFSRNPEVIRGDSLPLPM